LLPNSDPRVNLKSNVLVGIAAVSYWSTIGAFGSRCGRKTSPQASTTIFHVRSKSTEVEPATGTRSGRENVGSSTHQNRAVYVFKIAHGWLTGLAPLR